MPKVRLKPGRQKSLERRHPWIFSGAIADIEGAPRSGETVEVIDADGAFRGLAAYSPGSQIALRMWTFEAGESVDEAFMRRRIEGSLARRGAPDTDGLAPGGVSGNAYRLVNAEADALPGLVVDRYADCLVFQFRSAGAERWREEIVSICAELVPHGCGWERSDTESRAKEGLEPRAGEVAGLAPPPPLVEIREGPFAFLVDVRSGHKTGFYLDQRDNRAIAGSCAAGREALNVFSYTGAFGVWALGSGAASVTNVESAPGLLELGARNFACNQLDDGRVEDIQGDAFQVLRRFRDSRREFDLIVLDPPKFAESSHQVERAARGYKDINLLAIKLLRPGGMLLTFSCSAHVRPELFQKIVAGAALDSGREVRVLRRLSQSGDHTEALRFPESGYLKGLWCSVDE